MTSATLDHADLLDRPAPLARTTAETPFTQDRQTAPTRTKIPNRFRRTLQASAAALLLAVAAGAGTLYWSSANHFESTDDAFIAARQFNIAPKVSGYLTAVPVTDNQHLKTGEDFLNKIPRKEAVVTPL